MKFPIYGKIIQLFQTTNQIKASFVTGYHFQPGSGSETTLLILASLCVSNILTRKTRFQAYSKPVNVEGAPCLDRLIYHGPKAVPWFSRQNSWCIAGAVHPPTARF